MAEDLVSLDQLLHEVKSYNPKADLELIKKAYVYAEEHHGDQKRKSGVPYTQHLLHAALILADLRLDTTTIAAGLLHDVIEDTPVTYEKLQTDFNEDIASLVQSLTKISKIHFKSSDEASAENIRKVVLATSKDIRVIFIKLADRLHNMRTLKFMSEEAQQRISQETREIYAPIAHKLGIYKIKSELEDIAFKYLEPEEYQTIKEKIGEKRTVRETRIKNLIQNLKDMLKKHNIPAKVKGRSKSFHSIHTKINTRGYAFEDINDLLACRIIVKSTEDCYKTMYLLHENYQPLMQFFYDYIAQPKGNGYQSIHTKVLYDGVIAEVQIRSLEMDQEAEAGIAAHWRYKKTKRDKKFDQKIAWLKQILEWKQELPDATAKDFIEHLRVELFKDEIICFTPKGEPITLPEGACPLDFAYAVHTNVGDKCARCRVNGEQRPLDARLQSGDMVEIVTQNNAKPSRQWLKFVRTATARSKIRKALGIEMDPKKSTASNDIVTQNVLEHLELNTTAPIRTSRCCTFEYGSPVRAFMSSDGKVGVHAASCPNIGSLAGNKEIDVSWKGEAPLSEAQLILTVDDQVGVAALILSVIAQYDMNITTINSDPRKDRYVMYVGVQVNTQEKLEQLMQALRKLKPVQYVTIA